MPDLHESPLLPLLEPFGARIHRGDEGPRISDFGDAEAEALLARRSVVLIDRPDRARFEIRGAKVRRLLNGQLTADPRNLAGGYGLEALHLSPKGKVLAELCLLARAEDRILLDLPRLVLEPMRLRFERMAVLDDCLLSPPEAAPAVFDLIGPEAGAVLADLFGIDLHAMERPGRNLEFEHQGGAVVLSLHAETGERTFRLSAAPAVATEIAGVILSREGLRPAGFDALRILQLEVGRPSFGVDYGPDNLAPECRMDHTIDYTKGCYVGQEVVARIRTYGQVNRKLVSLCSSDVLRAGAALRDDSGQERGLIRSAAHSPQLDAWVALAMVHRDHIEAGTELLATLDFRQARATVVDGPLEGTAFPIARS